MGEDTEEHWVGGAFLRASDPETLYQWYETHLKLKWAEGCFVFQDEEQGRGYTVFAFIPENTQCFGSGWQQALLSFRVQGLDLLLEELAAGGVEVDPSARPMNAAGCMVGQSRGKPGRTLGASQGISATRAMAIVRIAEILTEEGKSHVPVTDSRGCGVRYLPLRLGHSAGLYGRVDTASGRRKVTPESLAVTISLRDGSFEAYAEPSRCFPSTTSFS